MTDTKTPLADAAAIALFKDGNRPFSMTQVSEHITRHTHADEMLGLLREWDKHMTGENHSDACRGSCTCYVAATEKLLRELGKETKP